MNHDAPSVLILHNVPRGASAQDAKAAWHESDVGVMDEVEAVRAALATRRFPHRVAGIRTLRDLSGVLSAAPEEVVFNLVEGLDGRAEDASFVPAICQSFGKACTGGDTHCLMLTLDKWQTKTALAAEGLPTARAVIVPPGRKFRSADVPFARCIVKPVRCDASEGIDSTSVVDAPSPALWQAVRRIHRQFDQPALVEEFIGTRELNVSLLQSGEEVHVLPLAEIDFSAFPAGRPRIVDYAAKWLSDTFEYNNTPRITPAPLPAGIARRVRKLALAVWRTLGCRDYVRVDFRLDDDAQASILEVNPNPDISPGDGFPAALQAAGIEYDEFVEIVIKNAFARRQP